MAFDNPLNLTPEQLAGFDTDRIWATGLQVFIQGDFSLIVFREQMDLLDQNTGETKKMVKNLTSVIMPTEVVRQLKNILNGLIPDTEVNGVG